LSPEEDWETLPFAFAGGTPELSDNRENSPETLAKAPAPNTAPNVESPEEDWETLPFGFAGGTPELSDNRENSPETLAKVPAPNTAPNVELSPEEDCGMLSFIFL